MKPQHTPTPWELYQDEDLGHWFIWAKGNMAANIPRRIDGIDKANADFIVRAVNSHEALLKAAKHWEVCDFPHEIRFRCKDCVMAEKAINQAEGK
jgi:hypothetical protein